MNIFGQNSSYVEVFNYCNTTMNDSSVPFNVLNIIVPDYFNITD